MKKNKTQINLLLLMSYSDIKCAMSKKEIQPHEGDHLKKQQQYVKKAV